MRRRFSQGIGWQYLMRTLTICVGLLCFFLMLFAGVQHIKRENLHIWHFEALQKTLSPPLIAAVRAHDRPQIQALFKGLIDGQSLLGIRLVDKSFGWQESAYSETATIDSATQSYRFFINQTTADGSPQQLSVEMFAAEDLSHDRDGAYLAVILCLAGTCFLFLIIALSLHVRSSFVRPIHELQEKISELQVHHLLESTQLIEPRTELLNEFDDLENNFLLLLRQVQLAHREALAAKSGFDFLNKNMTSELQHRQKKLEDELARSLNDNKLAALAEMASGIAHEINNPLAILVVRTAQLRDLVVQMPTEAATLETIVDSMENKILRIQESVRDLGTIASHPSFEECKPLKIHRVLQRLHDLATHRFYPKGLRLSLEMGMEAEVWAREVELTQALLYLIENAAEAALRQEKPWVALQLTEDAAGNLLVTIVDSGPGIEGSIREKIFQPFFTTKEVGKGRGVGLSLAQSIIQGNEGYVSFDFNAAHTTICVRLPRYKSALTAA